jgi:hypothetical protein
LGGLADEVALGECSRAVRPSLRCRRRASGDQFRARAASFRAASALQIQRSRRPYRIHQRKQRPEPMEDPQAQATTGLHGRPKRGRRGACRGILAAGWAACCQERVHSDRVKDGTVEMLACSWCCVQRSIQAPMQHAGVTGRRAHGTKTQVGQSTLTGRGTMTPSHAAQVARLAWAVGVAGVWA